MNNHVIFETAKSLKEAGFPIPKVKVAQMWYNEQDAPSFIVKNNGDEYGAGEHHYQGCSLMTGRVGNDFPESIVRERCYFAPTATDVLKELGGEFVICFLNGTWQVKKVIAEKNTSNPGPWPKSVGSTFWTESAHDNPAEAAAMAWLQLRKNKNDTRANDATPNDFIG